MKLAVLVLELYNNFPGPLSATCSIDHTSILICSFIYLRNVEFYKYSMYTDATQTLHP